MPLSRNVNGLVNGIAEGELFFETRALSTPIKEKTFILANVKTDYCSYEP